MIDIELPPMRQADHRLSDDHEAVADAFASFFANESPPELVRDAEPEGFDAGLWAKLTDMRAVAMGVPESAGGDGAGHVDLVLMTEQWGRYLGPVPLAETVVAARLLANVGGGTWLDEALAGTKLVTLALHPAVAGRGQLVPAAAVADAVVALVGDDLVVAAPATRPERLANQGHTPLARFDVGAADVETTVIASGSAAHEAYAVALREWRLLMAGALAGMAQGALDIAVEHAKDRIAFGVPIGSFQAVAHPIVDVAMATETARRLTRKAAWWADTDPSAERELLPMAYLYAEEAAVAASTTGVHVLGGVGFTVESDEQLYFRRAKGWTLVAGDPQRELDTIADLMFGPTGSEARS